MEWHEFAATGMALDDALRDHLLWDFLAPVIVGGAVAFLGIWVSRLRKRLEDSEAERAKLKAEQTEFASALRDGVQTLLFSKITEIHERYVQKGRPVPVGVKERARRIYASYHALGGNGIGTREWEEIRDAKQAPDRATDKIRERDEE